MVLMCFLLHRVERQDLEIEIESELKAVLENLLAASSTYDVNAVATLQKRQPFLIQHDPSNRQIELIDDLLFVCVHSKFGLALVDVRFLFLRKLCGL